MAIRGFTRLMILPNDCHVRPLCCLDESSGWVAVASVDEHQAVPLHRVSDRAIEGVDLGEGADGDAVLLVDDFVHSLEVELVDLELATGRGQPSGSPFDVPGVDLLEVLHGVGGAKLRPGAAWAPDPQRHRATGHPAAHVVGRERPPMVGVQVADEDLVEQVVRDLEAADADIGPRASVEDELVAVAQFHQEAGRGLALAG
jgi:hypothetical protein